MRVARLEQLKHVKEKAARNVSALQQQNQIKMEMKEELTETYDHMSKAQGNAYKMARLSNPRVLCVIFPKNLAYMMVSGE